MPEIEKKEHKVDQPKDEDVIVKTGKFRFYFQNYYTLISLLNDILLGLLYLTGGLVSLFDGPALIANMSYVLGAVFLLLRPVIKIARNIFIYDKEEYEKEVLQKVESTSSEKPKEQKESDSDDDTIQVGQEDDEKFEVE